CRFGLIDLHNGRLGPPGPVPLRVCRRVLRHFALSVIDLSLRRTEALRFAARLLRRAGRGAHTRALLRALPPFHSPAPSDAPSPHHARAPPAAPGGGPAPPRSAPPRATNGSSSCLRASGPAARARRCSTVPPAPAACCPHSRARATAWSGPTPPGRCCARPPR